MKLFDILDLKLPPVAHYCRVCILSPLVFYCARDLILLTYNLSSYISHPIYGAFHLALRSYCRLHTCTAPANYLLALHLLIPYVLPTIGELRAATATHDSAFAYAEKLKVDLFFTRPEINIIGYAHEANQIAIVVQSKKLDYNIISKRSILGLWIGRKTYHIEGAPLYYSAVYSTLGANIPPINFSALGIHCDLDTIIQRATHENDHTVHDLTNSMIKAGLYHFCSRDNIQFVDHLFRASFHIPSRLISDSYETKIFFLKNGELINSQNIDIKVEFSTFVEFIRFISTSYRYSYLVLSIIALSALVKSLNLTYEKILSFLKKL